MAILIQIIVGLMQGQTVGAALAALTDTQWVTLAIDAAELAAPDLEKLATTHPSLSAMVDELAAGAEHAVAAAAAIAWFKANQPKTISGYGPDGGVTEIPNPDAQ